MEETPKLDWQRVRTIFEDALLRPPAERQNYAKELCGSEESVWAEVRSLLDSHESSESFLETPAVAQVVETIRTDENQLAAGRRLLHYEIRELIGAGGMGEVYLARDTRLGRNVAIKLLRQDLLPHFRAGERLLREARASALLEHPNICQIHEISEVDGLSFIVMQYVVGTTLDEILSGRGGDAATALDIAAQVAEGLAEAHRQGVIHRDIKPANIIVSDKGHVKILDFGLAKFLEAESSTDAANRMESTGGVMGTVPFMSPEQLLGNPVDARTDVFSFGAMLFEMLTGVSAFGRKSNEETISAILTAEPDWSLLPPSLKHVLERCLAKDPSHRYASAREVAQALGAARKHIPGKSLTKAKTTGGQRLYAETFPMLDAVTLPNVAEPQKPASEPTEQTPRPNPRRLALFGFLAILVAGSVYGGYTLFNGNEFDTTAPTSVNEVRLIPFRKGDKFGFCDENKKLIIEAKYDHVRPFSEGLAIVGISRKPGTVRLPGDAAPGQHGSIDKSGNEIIPLKYDSISDFKNGIATVKVVVREPGNDQSKSGVIDRSGREIVSPQYDEIGRFVDGFARVVLKNKVGYINEKGALAIPLIYGMSELDAGDFSSGLAAVNRGGRYGYIDVAGEEAIPFKFDVAGRFSSDREHKPLAPVKIDNKCGYIGPEGEFIIPLKYANCRSFSQGFASVELDNKWGFIDDYGNEITPFEYDSAGEFHDGLARVATEGVWGFIDGSGREVIPPKYWVYPGQTKFNKGLADVCISEGVTREGPTSLPKLKCGFIDKAGNEIIPLKYDFHHGSTGDLALVSFDRKEFYIDRNGVEYYEPSLEMPAAPSACTYDVANDFSATMNPNGPWTFGYTSTLGGTLVIYDTTKIGEGILNFWYRGDHFNAPFPPEVGHNSGEPLGSGIDRPSNGFFLHPGPDGTFSVARWTAPASGMFNMNAMFKMADRGSTDVHVLHNSLPIFDDVIAGRADSASFNTGVSVSAGDTIDFSVGHAGNYVYDSTDLRAAISSTKPCP